MKTENIIAEYNESWAIQIVLVVPIVFYMYKWKKLNGIWEENIWL